MTVKVTKPALNLREELSSLKKPSGVAGEAMLRAETPQEQFNLIGAGRKNLIINGDFQVTQRADYSSPVAMVSAKYHVDRFKTDIVGAGGTVQVLTNQDVLGINANTMKVNCTSAGTGYLDTIQKIETPAGLQGQTLTLSFYLKSNMNFWIRGGSLGLNPTYHNIGNTNGQWKRVEVQIKTTVGYNTTYIGFSTYDGSNHSIAVGDYYEVAMMQLELGSVATPFEHRSYGEELALCQRYYIKFGPSQIIGRGHVPGSTSFTDLVVVNTPVPMRVLPAAILSGSLQVVDGSTSASSTYVNAVYGLSPSGFACNITLSSTLTSYRPTAVYPNAPSSYLAFDAEL